MDHQIIRHRHEIKRRSLTVKDKGNVTPGMIRITLEGGDLADFTSLSPDDHVKLFIPSGAGEPDRRDYTPRSFDREAGTLTLDFAVHDAGPATRWAIDAAVGDVLDIAGPRGSVTVSPTFDWWLLVGDETALPAMGRRLEELPAGVRVITVAAVAGAEEEQRFSTQTDHQAIWVHRPLADAADPAPVLDALKALALPEGDGFVWVASEAQVARAVRDYVSSEWNHPKGWLKAAGYWKQGVADAHEKLED
ncbi:MAG: siderophore-interacting protein [Sphingobium sp.]